MIQTLFGNTGNSEDKPSPEKPSFFERMKQAVTRTRVNLIELID